MQRNNKIPYYDLHCHLLPGIDDGCSSVEESIACLQMEKEQGCFGVICTPHYYNKESILEFYNRRLESYKTLMTAIEEGCYDLPGIVLGAEVYYHNGLIHDPYLKYLTLGTSNYILLEMPFKNWNPRILRDVQAMISVNGLIPVIAHLERYLDLVEPQYIDELLSMDVVVQMNAGFIIKNTKKAFKRIDNDLVQVISSDAHNMSNRLVNMEEAINLFAKKRRSDRLEEILENNRNIFAKAAGF